MNEWPVEDSWLSSRNDVAFSGKGCYIVGIGVASFTGENVKVTFPRTPN